MSGDKVCSPDPESAPVTTYYSHSLDIQTYQNMLFLQVYVAPSQGKREKNLLAHTHDTIDIDMHVQESLILNFRNNRYQKRPFLIIYTFY